MILEQPCQNQHRNQDLGEVCFQDHLQQRDRVGFTDMISFRKGPTTPDFKPIRHVKGLLSVH